MEERGVVWDVSEGFIQMKGEGKGVSGGVSKFWVCVYGYCVVVRGCCASEV